MGIGILLGGVIAERFGFTAAFYTVAAMQAAGMILFILFTRTFYERRRLDEN